MAEGHARYKEIVEEDGPELAHWLKIGREGTIAANHGGSAFGGKAAHEPTSKVESQKCVEVQHALMHHTIRVVMHTHTIHIQRHCMQGTGISHIAPNAHIGTRPCMCFTRVGFPRSAFVIHTAHARMILLLFV
jgi:hypothetical protein